MGGASSPSSTGLLGVDRASVYHHLMRGERGGGEKRSFSPDYNPVLEKLSLKIIHRNIHADGQSWTALPPVELPTDYQS